MENKEVFNFTYSAKEQAEIKAIRKRYSTTGEEDKLAQLRKLDNGVTQKATATSLAVGVIGALILGMGMSLIMTEFGKVLGAFSEFSMLIGIIFGVLGIVIVSVAYPIYNIIIKKERAKIAPEILRLTEELLK